MLPLSSAFRRPTFWLLAVLTIVGAVVRFRALDFGLPYTQARPDETAIIEPVRALLSGRVPLFFDYPWLYLWVLSACYLGFFVWGWVLGYFHTVSEMVASWPVHWEPFFLISRSISAVLGTATIAIVYRLGRQVRDEMTGLVAALFVTFVAMHVRNSHYGTTDVAMTFLCVAGVSLLIDAHRTSSLRAFAVAGAVCGLAAATKYNGVILGVPMIVGWAWTLARPGGTQPGFAGKSLAYFGAAFVAAFAIGVPFVVLEPRAFLNAMDELNRALRVGEPRLDLGNGWVHHLTVSLRYGAGVPILTLGLAGAVALLWTKPRTGAIFLAFPLAYYGVAGALRLLFFRYVLPVVPFLCVTTAYVVCLAGAFVVSRLPLTAPRQTLVLRALTLIAAVAIVWPSVVSVAEFNRVMGQEDSRVVLANWFTDHVPPGSSVLQSGSRFGLAQFQRGTYAEWRWDGVRRTFFVNEKRVTSDARPEWIVVQHSPLPSATQEAVTEFLTEPYVEVAELDAFTPSDDLVYDLQDAFFVPVAGLDAVVRPGPNYSVYRREPARPISSDPAHASQ